MDLIKVLIIEDDQTTLNELGEILKKESYEVITFDSYPKANEEIIIGEVEDYKHWIVHRTDLDMSYLAEMTRMQLWTLKPAHEHP